MLLDELDSYKQKILYFLRIEDTDQSPEYLLEKKNLNFNDRINKLHDWTERHAKEYQASIAELRAL